MPELGEVEYYRRRWDAGLGGKILKVEAHPKARPLKGVDVPALTRALEGARLASSSRHGKQLFFYFQPRAVLGLHMGMTGHLSVREPGYEAKRHDHLVLRQKERTLVFEDFRMFGRVRFSQGKEKAAWEKDLPPEILDPAFTLPYLAAALKGRRGPLKALLLDQAIFPGIGNWMADEVLWLARIAPRQAAGSLPRRPSARSTTRCGKSAGCPCGTSRRGTETARIGASCRRAGSSPSAGKRAATARAAGSR